MASRLIARALFAHLVLQNDPNVQKACAGGGKTKKKQKSAVEYADETNSKYPLDTKKNVQAALAYLSMPSVAAQIDSEALTAINKRIKSAAEKFGINVSEQSIGNDVPVTQSHYYMDGSVEEFTSKVRTAFNTWRKECDEYEDRWGTILAIFDNSLLYYTNSWDTGSVKYYMVNLAVDGDSVSIDGENKEEVGVKMVMTTLGPDEDNDTPEQAAPGGTSVEKTQAEIEAEKVVQAGDVVDKGTSVKDDALASGATEHSSDNPAVVAPTTAAETAGASVPDPSGDALRSGEREFSGDEGVGPEAGDNSTEGAVKAAMAKVPSGTKQAMEVQSMAVDAHQESLAYMKLQSVEETTSGKMMRIQGIATRGDIVNGAGQVYPTSVWQANMKKMNEDASNGKFIGKLEHPGKEQGLVDAAIKFDKFWLQGSDVWFDATVIPTAPHGQNLQALIEAGIQVDMSTRGYGSFQMQDWRGTERPVMQDDFVCTAVDAVWKGASTGSGVKTVAYQSELQPGEETTMEQTVETSKVQSATDWAADIRNADELKRTGAALMERSGLSELGQKAYQAAIDKCETVEALQDVATKMLPILQSTFPKEETTETVQSEVYAPKFYVKQTAEERAPKTVGEMFERMVQDLPDTYEGQGVPHDPKVPNHFTSPRKACYQMLCNIANSRNGAFSGRHAAMSMLALEAGQIERAENILLQSLATGGTVAAANVDGDGAPLSNYLIFPLVRRVYPMYIMNRIAAIQPMDRPEGKIFFLDQYKVTAGGVETRIDLNTSSNPFSTSFADNATEGAAARLIRLRLASETISAHTKKLGAAWSVEEMQDLRAYHGLDAAQELMGGVAREMALEWNAEVLNDMVGQATACALTFGTTKPSAGFDNQKDWDEYLWVYLQKMDNEIFGKRNGPMTDLVCGMDAALALAKSMRGTFTIGGDGGAMDQVYPGTTFYGSVATPNGSRYNIFKTNFWASGTTNGSKIMGLRKGTEWSDTPYVWAPYADYVTPLLTDPADFTQKQGLVSRAGKKVVVSDAIGTLTIASSQGSVL